MNGAASPLLTRARLRATIVGLSTTVLLLPLAVSVAQADENPTASDHVLTTAVVGSARSGRLIDVRVTGTPSLPPGQTASATWIDPGTGVGATSYTTTGEDGTALFALRSWKSTTVSIAVGSAVVELGVDVVPERAPIVSPDGAPAQLPSYLVNDDPAGLGAGANASVLKISPERAASMSGVSWRRGCLPLRYLREVQVNYWGVDGYRHRGTLITRDSAASAVARSFTLLYEAGYRMTSMHPVDVYGPSLIGPGADDYASMAAGNTSMFNCRYQAGKELSRVWSPHASGRALDINPWENPYLSRGGLVPNAWWYEHRWGSPMVIQRGSVVTRILVANGWIWGARFDDLHHFDYAG